MFFYKIELTEDNIKNFWSKVDIKGEDDCWNWMAGKHIKGGYGKETIRRGVKTHTFVASRLAYLFFYGYLDEDLLVCHTCDNPPCVNPKHLFLGTNTDNQQDMIKKGRDNRASGEKLSVLSIKDVEEIRNLVSSGKKQVAVAKIFGVGKNTVWHIVNRTTWRKL